MSTLNVSLPTGAGAGPIDYTALPFAGVVPVSNEIVDVTLNAINGPQYVPTIAYVPVTFDPTLVDYGIPSIIIPSSPPYTPPLTTPEPNYLIFVILALGLMALTRCWRFR